MPGTVLGLWGLKHDLATAFKELKIWSRCRDERERDGDKR